MVRNRQSRKTAAKSAPPTKRLPKSEYAKLAKRMIKQKEGKSQVKRVSYDRIQELLTESTLQCPICLQIFLKPILAQCGHIFCLNCGEELAKNNYPCGICHNYEPTYDLTIYQQFQQLVRIYLTKCTEEERKDYELRQKHYQEKQSKRSIKKVQTGSLVDYWCIQQKCWKSALVSDADPSGIISLKDVKTGAKIQMNILSRRLAKHRFFTKEEPPVANQSNLFSSFSFGSMSQGVSPPIFGMPMFFNMLGGSGQGQGFRGMGSAEYFGYFPPYRPFSF